ncbi:hypothetical protein ACQ4PT_064306 [Festuca glaucescens]
MFFLAHALLPPLLLWMNSPGIRERLWKDDPPAYGGSKPIFSGSVPQWVFCGLAEKLQYVDDTVSVFDNLLIDSWSSSTLDHILCVLDCMRDEKVHVYWLCLGKELFDGLLPLVTDADLIDMRREAQVHKTLVIFVDHTNFTRLIRADLVRARAAIARVENVVVVQSALSEGAASTSIVVAQDVGQECVQSAADDSDSDSSSDSEFFDSDYDAESGDDDLFLDNVDTDLHDNNERVFTADIEDDSQLEDRDLNLEEGERLMLQYKFQAFNPAVDMNSPVFKIGMKFASIEEARQAVNAYNIRERVKTRKTKNDKTRLHAICEEGCPWRLKIGFDLQRSGGYVVTSYEGNHTCERVYEMRTLTAKFLCRQFIDEFRDNQKMDLQSFAAKVQRKYNMCPDRWKLGRARKVALLEIHGNEEAQFALLRDYGEELKRANPGSTFFLSTNSVKESGTDIVKEHLATMYWSYDACKRGFLSGCRPLICVDGFHIKTRYKGVLLTAVGIDPNDCIFPIAMGMVEVECTSSWVWFLTTLRDDLNITNTSPWTIMSDRQKGLINAVEKVFPDAEHRFFVRHLIQNFQKVGHRGETLKNDLWAIARSTNIPKWQKNMDKMKVDSEQAYEWVEELVPNTWIKAFFSDFSKCEMLLNNHSENLFPQNPDPALDPRHRQDHMVYMMGQEAATHVPIAIAHEPLPESEFVVNARKSMPEAIGRMTTATTRDLNEEYIPEMNVQEMQLSQNAPSVDDI